MPTAPCFYERDLHETDLTKADVLTIYLLPEVNLMVRPRILASQAGHAAGVARLRLRRMAAGCGDLTMDAPGKPVGRDQKSKVMLLGGAIARGGQMGVEGAGGSVYELQLDQVFQKIAGTHQQPAGAQCNHRKSRAHRRSHSASKPGLDKGRREFSGKVIN